MTIRLHKELGVNPRLCFCPRCGGESPSLVLAGALNHVDTCLDCGTAHYGGMDRGRCQKCKSSRKERREWAEHEKFPGDLCDACVVEQTQFDTIVAEGGLYWRCSECRCTGVIKPSEFTKKFREENNMPTGKLGVRYEFCKAHNVSE